MVKIEQILKNLCKYLFMIEKKQQAKNINRHFSSFI